MKSSGGFRNRWDLMPDCGADCFVRGGRSETHFATGAKRGYRITDRFADADREHQRRLAYGFAAVDRSVLRRVLQKLDVEAWRYVAYRGNLIGACRVRQQPAITTPSQLFCGEPAHSLDETAFDLSAIDAGVQRVADV